MRRDPLPVRTMRVAGAIVLWLLASQPALAEDWHATEGGYFQLRVAPVGDAVTIGEFQDWHLELRANDGRPIRGATITMGGGMRSHGHGLPSQPAVSEQMRAGQYLIEGVKLNMKGDWTLAFSIDTDNGRDRALILWTLSQESRADYETLLPLTLSASTAPPASVSNRYANDSAAAAFGEQLFFDKRLSNGEEFSCASCHQPERFYSDGLRIGHGVNAGTRNTPTLIGAAYQSWFYWDGRRDSLWSQALVPFEAPDEMGSSRLAVVRLIATDADYRVMYETVFGKIPKNLTFEKLPQHAGPIGDPAVRDAWYRMPRNASAVINEVFANLGKAIAAFQRTLPAPRARFDEYVDRLRDAPNAANSVLSADERAGLELFLDEDKTHCLRCHNGNWFSNNGFNNIGTGDFSGDTLDFGRIYGLAAALRDEFNCVGPYSDAEPKLCKEHRYLNRSTHVPLEGAFKVPSLRNLAHTPPYMHDGRFATLSEVIDYYRNPPVDGPPHELPTLLLTDSEAAQLLTFLDTLSADKLH